MTNVITSIKNFDIDFYGFSDEFQMKFLFEKRTSTQILLSLNR